jgi:hypothetical protein
LGANNRIPIAVSPVRPKSICSPWGRGKQIDFQAYLNFVYFIADSYFLL